jgi:hypothetical protein
LTDRADGRGIPKSLRQWGPTARDLRRSLAETPAGERSGTRGGYGCAGIAEEWLRQVFETDVHEPPVSIKLTSLASAHHSTNAQHQHTGSIR